MRVHTARAADLVRDLVEHSHGRSLLRVLLRRGTAVVVVETHQPSPGVAAYGGHAPACRSLGVPMMAWTAATSGNFHGARHPPWPGQQLIADWLAHEWRLQAGRAAAGDDGDGDGGDGDDAPAAAPAADAAKPKTKIKLSYEDYQRYRLLITTHLRSRATLDDVPGLRRSAILDWYLRVHADEVGDEVAAHTKLLKQIPNVLMARCIHPVGVIRRDQQPRLMARLHRSLSNALRRQVVVVTAELLIEGIRHSD